MTFDHTLRARRQLLALCCALLISTLAVPAVPVAAQQPPAGGPAAAQVAEPDGAPATEPGSELRVFLLTMGPGDLVYERFGHNALWIRDEARGTDTAYDWGLFDFNQENFILRFVQGRMWYSMGGADAERRLAPYIWTDRAVWAQELNLSSRQKVELRDFVEWNERPENAFYRYDYYLDNCSTRVRDAIDRVLGGQIRAQTASVGSGESYRSHTRRLTADDVPSYTALNAALGRGVDREISVWEEMFVPMELRDHLRTLTIRDEAGNAVPLVIGEQTLHHSARAPEREAPPSWTAGYLLAGALLGGALALLAGVVRRSRAARLGFSALAGFWTLFAGTGGVVMAGLWAFTDHAAAYANENLFQLNPLALPLVVLVPALAYGARWAARPALWLAVAAAALSLLGLLLKALPFFFQVNGEIIALALPAQLGLAWAVWRLGVAAPAPEPAAARRARPVTPARRRGAAAR